jgi:rod shape-determining protein MreC
VQSKQIRRRRAVLALLVAVSLILLTAYFGESSSSPLHSVQSGVVDVLSPVQDGASRVLSPVRDIAGWFSSTVNAKSQVAELKTKNEALTKQLDAAKYDRVIGAQAQKIVELDTNANLSKYGLVNATVIAENPIAWYDTIEVNRGSDDGVRVNDPVVGDGGLVGRVSEVGSTWSDVTLLTSPKFAVGAMVLEGPGKADTGEIEPAVGSPDTLTLEYLPSNASISQGDQVVTSGFKDQSNPKIDSLYPADIPIGTVSNANTADTLINNQDVYVTPLVDLRHLSLVQILTQPQAGTTESAGL